MKLRLRKDLVLVEPFEPPSKIIIPEDARTGSQFGRVVNAGEKADVREGDTVIFAEHDGEKTKIYGKDLLVLFARDVLAVA